MVQKPRPAAGNLLRGQRRNGEHGEGVLDLAEEPARGGRLGPEGLAPDGLPEGPPATFITVSRYDAVRPNW